MGNVWSTGFANDIIVVKQPDGTLRCSAVNVRFRHQDDVVSNWNEKNVTVSVNDRVLNFSPFSLHELNDREFRFSPLCLKSMKLRDDLNDITFTIKIRGQDDEVIKARMFLWGLDSRIVITDVDGTITKSDKRGIVMLLMDLDWTRDGVCHLFSAIQKNGYKVIYLTGRPRNEAEATRKLLDDVKQDGKVLPKGPVIVSPDGLRAAVKREVWTKTQDVDFKVPTLEQIRGLFPDHDHPVQSEGGGPYYAGFGNRQSDRNTYLELNIPCTSIFHLSSAEIMGQRRANIMVKCGTTTLATFDDGYIGLSSFVEKLFPPKQDCAVPAAEERKKGRSSQNWLQRAKEYFISLGRP